MNPSKLSFLLLIVSMGLFCFPVSPAQSQPRDLEDIVAQAEQEILPVRVVATDPAVRAIAVRALQAHGAFRLADSGTPVYTFTLETAGASDIRLVIQSGRPAQTLLQQTFSASSQRQAILRALDEAVRRTTGLRGIFAGRVAFVSDRSGSKEIHMSDFLFGEVRRLTNDRSQSIMPRWSPDGSRLLYTGYFQSGFPDIFAIDVNTMQRTPFVSLQGTNTGARFSPDGQMVAMILSGPGNPEVFVSNSTGRQLRRLTRTPSIEATPTWSPDGRRLVVTSDTAGRPQLYLLGVEGGALQRIPTNISGYCAEPDWNHANPDLIAFTVASGRGFQVAVYSFSERRSRIITREAGDAIEPHWLPDGRHILFTSRTASTERIGVVDSITGKTTMLSPIELNKAAQASYWHPGR